MQGAEIVLMIAYAVKSGMTLEQLTVNADYRDAVALYLFRPRHAPSRFG